MLPSTAISPSSRRGAFPGLTLVFALIALGLHVWPVFDQKLFYEREAVRAGEWWRLWTGHFVHFGFSHLAWNLAVFVPAAAWAERIVPGRTRLLLLLAPGFISAVLFSFDPALQRYGGLSGVATGLLAFLAFVQLGRGRSDRWFWWAVLGLLALKIAAETLTARPVLARFTEAGAQSVPLAHLAGVGAAAIAFFVRSRPRFFSRQ